MRIFKLAFCAIQDTGMLSIGFKSMVFKNLLGFFKHKIVSVCYKSFGKEMHMLIIRSHFVRGC